MLRLCSCDRSSFYSCTWRALKSVSVQASGDLSLELTQAPFPGIPSVKAMQKESRCWVGKQSPPLDRRNLAEGTAVGRDKESQPFLRSISYTPSPSVLPVGTLPWLCSNCLGLCRTIQAHVADEHGRSVRWGSSAHHGGQHSPRQEPSCCEPC